MTDRTLEIGQAIIAALKASLQVRAIVGVRVYDEPPAKPTWPFIRYGFPIKTPFVADGWDAGAYRLTVHAFAQGPGKEKVLTLAAAIEAALDEQSPEYGTFASVILLRHAQTSLIRDSDVPSRYHAVIEFDAASAELTA